MSDFLLTCLHSFTASLTLVIAYGLAQRLLTNIALLGEAWRNLRRRLQSAYFLQRVRKSSRLG